MDEQKKYEVIKKLVDSQGNKDRAAITLGISRRQVDRLIIAYKEKGKAASLHGNRGRKPAITTPDEVRNAVVDLYRTKYYEANFVHFTELLQRNEGITLSASAVTSFLETENILPGYRGGYLHTVCLCLQTVWYSNRIQQRPSGQGTRRAYV